jgi:hypothetical protein
MTAYSQFTIRTENDIYIGSSPPTNPYTGQLWQDTGVTPSVLRVYDGAVWVVSNADETNTAIQDTVSVITDTLESSISQTKSGIELMVSETYAEKSETQSLQDQITSILTQTPETIQMKFEEAITQAETVDGRLQQFIESLDAYIKFGLISQDIYGVEIGRSDSPFTVRITNQKFSILQNGTEVAYVDNNTMKITRAEILNNMSIGSVSNGGYFDFITAATGLGLKWRNS